MNRPDRNFRLSKETKRTLARIYNPEHRNSYKRLMIDAELEMKKAPPKSEKGSKTE